jgi:hypothetical protein
MAKKVRQPGFAGTHYSQQKGILEREVAVLLESAKPVSIPGKLFGMVVPCDKQLVSGGVAARAFRQLLEENVDDIVVISPSHRTYFEEISIYDGDAYSTPLGEVLMEKDVINELVGFHNNIIASSLGHESDEHGIEVQLPFLQQVLYDFKLIPIVMGNQDPTNVAILTEALTKVLKGRNIAIIASSNLSGNHTADQASLVDKIAMNHIQKFDIKNLLKDFQEEKIELSGCGPLAVTMGVCKNLGATKSDILLYRNSGDTGSSKKSVTGFVSAIFHS